jgi:hypothetical protein
MLWHTTLVEKGKELKVVQMVNQTSPLWLIHSADSPRCLGCPQRVQARIMVAGKTTSP